MFSLALWWTVPIRTSTDSTTVQLFPCISNLLWPGSAQQTLVNWHLYWVLCWFAADSLDQHAQQSLHLLATRAKKTFLRCVLHLYFQELSRDIHVQIGSMAPTKLSWKVLGFHPHSWQGVLDKCSFRTLSRTPPRTLRLFVLFQPNCRFSIIIIIFIMQRNVFWTKLTKTRVYFVLEIVARIEIHTVPTCRELCEPANKTPVEHSHLGAMHSIFHAWKIPVPHSARDLSATGDKILEYFLPQGVQQSLLLAYDCKFCNEKAHKMEFPSL